jgi:hypothetical protein
MCIGALDDSKYAYQPRSNIVKNGKCGFVTDSHSILARRRNHFSQLLSVHEVNDGLNRVHLSFKWL